jgi:hypothetical protein
VSSRAAQRSWDSSVEAIWRGSGPVLWEEKSRGGRSGTFGILWDAIDKYGDLAGRGYYGARLLFGALNM